MSQTNWARRQRELQVRQDRLGSGSLYLGEGDLARFNRKAGICGPDDCWLWQGKHSTGGYAFFRHSGGSESVHRIAYKHWHGEVPSKHVISHTCKVDHCVNPKHLIARTRSDAAMGGAVTRKENPRVVKCRHGRAYSNCLNCQRSYRAGFRAGRLALEYSSS